MLPQPPKFQEVPLNVKSRVFPYWNSRLNIDFLHFDLIEMQILLFIMLSMSNIFEICWYTFKTFESHALHLSKIISYDPEKSGMISLHNGKLTVALITEILGWEMLANSSFYTVKIALVFSHEKQPNLPAVWWVCIWWSYSDLNVGKLPSSVVSLIRFWSFQLYFMFKSVCLHEQSIFRVPWEVILLRILHHSVWFVAWRPGDYSQGHFNSWYNPTLSITASTASRTWFSTPATTLSTSFLTLSTLFLSVTRVKLRLLWTGCALP